MNTLQTLTLIWPQLLVSPVRGVTVWRHPAGGLNHEGAVTSE